MAKWPIDHLADAADSKARAPMLLLATGHATPTGEPIMSSGSSTSSQTDPQKSVLETNKEIVLDFIEKAVNQGDIEAASIHFGEQYIQHNPNIADGADGFKSYVRQLRQSFPFVRGDIKRIFADGDFVIVHLHAKREPAEEGLAIVDIFRLEGGKLAEHWEVRQPIAQSALHANSMI